MSSTQNIYPCVFDWEDDENKHLSGGELLTVGDSLFSYFFRNSDGSVKEGLIAPKTHYPSELPLRPEWAKERYRLELEMLELIGTPCNVAYRNIGYISGERISHYHDHFIPRHDGEPSSGMGFGLLIRTHNEKMRQISEIAATCKDPATKAALHALLGTT